MLRFLSIRNLAIIDELEIEFDRGLTVLTGETGAGKSILVGAVGLLVGGRAAGDLVRSGKDTASIEAIFETADGRDVIVRREISAQGRSRAFVDGALATSSALRDLSRSLVDLHGQHDHQVLLDPSSHLDVLDAYAGGDEDRGLVAGTFAAWQQVRGERDRLLTHHRERASRSEFLAFQVAEIDRVAPKPGEDEEFAATRQVLANRDKLDRLCGEAYQSLYEGDQAALASLGIVWRKVAELAAIDERFAPYVAARDVVKPQLEDLAFFLRSYSTTIDASPGALQDVEDRLATLERLKKKHGPTLADVIVKRDQLQRELDELEHGTERLAELDAELERRRAAYLSHARALSSRRQAAATELSRALERSLTDLAMPRTRCDMRLTSAESDAQWTARGVEEAELYISPNPGEDLKPLARIASGGELSRVMLALKTLASTDAPGKTLIFDEVDVGIGGAVADVVGRRLQTLGERFQVLCITHLPQIAACGSAHVQISKAVRRGRTTTLVERLPPAGRQEELARMIGGSQVSPAVRVSAAEMLAAREPSRSTRAKDEKKAKGESENARGAR
jgi:DNA repair protein RecN (Recombination protein N)